MTIPAVRLGGCSCGAVRYEATGPALLSVGCCCGDCAKATGAPYTVWVGFEPDKIRFLTGEPAYRASSKTVLRGHCPNCGCTLTYARTGEARLSDRLTYVAATSIDDPNAFPPTEVVYYEERPTWFALCGELPLHGERSPDYGRQGRAVLASNAEDGANGD